MSFLQHIDYSQFQMSVVYYAANGLVSLFSSSSDDYIDFVVFVCLSSAGPGPATHAATADPINNI